MDIMMVLQLAMLAVLAGVVACAVRQARRSGFWHATYWILGGALFWAMAPWRCGVLHFYPGEANCQTPMGLSVYVHGGTDPWARVVGGDLMVLAASRLAIVGLLGLVVAVAMGKRIAARSRHD